MSFLTAIVRISITFLYSVQTDPRLTGRYPINNSKTGEIQFVLVFEFVLPAQEIFLA